MPGASDGNTLALPSPEEALQKLRTENALLRRELTETQNTTTQYLQNVAHQLTAPLNAIKWSIEAIKDEKVPISRKTSLLSSIYSQGTILVHLIKNFSLMSNLEADHELGQFREQPERVDPIRLAINLANDFDPQAREKGIRIVIDELSFQQVFQGKSLLAVKNLIAQALSNLLENAVKYSNLKTSITMHAASVKLEPSGGAFIGLAVTNIGLPIAPDEIKTLLNRGVRGQFAKQHIPAGTGIGLYIASRIMRIHNGIVHIRAKNKESTFTLFFPESRIK
jgi:signal transduction histidine kinase